jgi:large subunit ribosomal protein L2
MMISKYKPLKSKIKRSKKYAGRNNQGRITVRHQGGGHKQLYRKVDSYLNLNAGIIVGFEYDPNRSGRIAKVLYSDYDRETKSYSYISAPKNLKVFDKVQTLTGIKDVFLLHVGDTSVLANFAVGDYIYNVEEIPGRGPKYARAAGTYCKVLQHYSKQYLKLLLPSGEEKLISTKASAILGSVSNEEHYKKKIGKAGRSR